MTFMRTTATTSDTTDKPMAAFLRVSASVAAIIVLIPQL
jgi:hypothetical protein